MMVRLRQWAVRFDAMSLRERLLILLTLVVSVTLLCFIYLIEPAQMASAKLRTELQLLQAQSAEARVDYELMRAAEEADPDRALQDRIDQLLQQSERQAQQFERQSAALVSPPEMMALLQQVLKGQPGIRLVEARKAAPVTLSDAAAEDAAVSSADLYRHDLELVLEGDLAQVQSFLTALENANESLFWHSIDYQLGQSPKARLTLQVYTLNTTREWLGI